MRLYALQGARSSLCLIIQFGYYILSSWLILVDSLYTSFSVAIPLLYSLVIMCVYLHFILQYYHVILVDFIACSGYFRLCMYTWDIFLAYIYRRLSSRLRFHVFWEARRYRVFVVSEPGLK